MNHYKKYNLSLILLLFFSSMFLIISFWEYNNYKIMMVVLLVYFVICFFLSFSFGIFNLYQIFLLTTFYFLLGRTILDLLGYCDIRLATLVITKQISDTVMIETFKIILVFLTGITSGFVAIKLCKHKDAIFWFAKKRKCYLLKYYKILFYIYTTLSFFKMLIFVRLCIEYGYKDAIFGGIIDEYPYPFFLIGVNTISFFLYLLVIFYDRSKKNFIVCSGLTMFIALINMFTGQRGPAMLKMVMILWIWGTFYKKLGVKILLLGMVGLISFTQFFLWFRRIFIGVVSHNRFNPLVQSLYDTSVSIYVISFLLEYKEKLANKVPFFLGYVTDLFTELGNNQNMKRINNGNYLGDHLTYTLNSNVFLTNGNSGTSIYAEAIDLVSNNLLLLFLFSFFLIICIYLIYCQMYRVFPLFIVAYFTLSRFYYSPRDSIGKVLKDIFIPITMGLVIYFLEMYLNSKYSKFYKKYNNEVNNEIK